MHYGSSEDILFAETLKQLNSKIIKNYTNLYESAKLQNYYSIIMLE